MLYGCMHGAYAYVEMDAVRFGWIPRNYGIVPVRNTCSVLMLF